MKEYFRVFSEEHATKILSYPTNNKFSHYVLACGRMYLGTLYELRERNITKSFVIKENPYYVKHLGQNIARSYFDDYIIGRNIARSYFDDYIKTDTKETYEMYNKMRDPISIKDVIYSPPATIVLWSDGTKTVVKCGEKDTYDWEKGLAMCIAKKSLGNKGNYYDIFSEYAPKENVNMNFAFEKYLLNAILNGAINSEKTEDK